MKGSLTATMLTSSCSMLRGIVSTLYVSRGLPSHARANIRIAENNAANAAETVDTSLA